MAVFIDPRLIMNDGTILPEGSAGYSDHRAWFWVKGLTMAEAFAMFNDPSKTRVIKHQYGTREVVYTGFTTMNLIKQSEFTVDIRMEGENTSVDTHDIPEEEGPENELDDTSSGSGEETESGEDSET